MALVLRSDSFNRSSLLWGRRPAGRKNASAFHGENPLVRVAFDLRASMTRENRDHRYNRASRASPGAGGNGLISIGDQPSESEPTDLRSAIELRCSGLGLASRCGRFGFVRDDLLGGQQIGIPAARLDQVAIELHRP